MESTDKSKISDTPKVILVSGTPGTGKTEVAKILAEHYGYEYIHIGEDEEYIMEREAEVKVIDVKKMINFLKKKQEASPKALVIDSHLSHYFPPDRTRICIVLRCDPAELKNRLVQREYPEFKIRINLEAEAMDLILQEAIKEGHKVHEIDTTNKTGNASAEEAIKAIDKEETTHGKIDFTYYLKNPKNLTTIKKKKLMNQ